MVEHPPCMYHKRSFFQVENVQNVKKYVFRVVLVNATYGRDDKLLIA